jgi:hypothetical protein
MGRLTEKIQLLEGLNIELKIVVKIEGFTIDLSFALFQELDKATGGGDAYKGIGMYFAADGVHMSI